MELLLKTDLEIGRIDIGLLNRIIIEDFNIKDQHRAELLKVARLSARFDIQALFKGKISINSVQLFGFDLQLNKQTPEDKLNMQFIIDALSSDRKEQSKLDLRINSLLIRRGKMSYNVASEPLTPKRFNPNHVKINNIVGAISLKALQNDSINANIKRLSLTEDSGVEIKKLSLKVVANRDLMKIDNIKLELPNTEFSANTINLAYHDIQSFNQFADKVDFSFNTLPSYFTLSDFRAFVPAFKNFEEKIDLAIEVDGTLNNLHLKRLYLNSANHLNIQGSGSLNDITKPNITMIEANLKNFFVDQEGINFLVRNFSDRDDTPPVLKRLGFVKFKGLLTGFFKDFVTYGEFSTGLGKFKTDLKFSYPKDKAYLNYEGNLATQSFNLGGLSGNSKIGKISFNLNVKGEQLEAREYPNIMISGNVSQFVYQKYNYENIAIDGLYKSGGFDGSLHLADKNAVVDLMGSFNLTSTTPSFNFIANLEEIRPYELNLSNKYEKALFSVNIDADFTGKSLDDLNGEININNLHFTSTRQNYNLSNFNITSKQVDNKSKLTINSDFMKGEVEGKYTYKSIYTSLVNIAKNYLPALTSSISTPKGGKNNFTFALELINTDLLTKFLNIPFQIYTRSTLKGYVNDYDNSVQIQGYFPKFRYNNQFFESGMLSIENPNDYLRTQLRISKQKKKSAVNFSIDSKAYKDSLYTNFFWGNNSNVTYSGNLKSLVHFERARAKSPLNLNIDVIESKIILNDTAWTVHPSHIAIKDEYIAIDDFKFTNDKQYVHLNGKVSTAPEDSIKLDLNDVNLGYIFEIANVDVVDFDGKVTGVAYASNFFNKKPNLNTTLHVENFTFNDGPMGDLDIYGKWDNEVDGIFLNANFIQKDKAGTKVKGHIYPVGEHKGLDLKITANGTNIKFLEGYMNGIASDVKGSTHGAVRLHGPFKELNLEGDLEADASLKFDVLNATFRVKDSLRLTKNGILFKDIAIQDIEGNRGKIEGALNYKHFKDLSYYFNIKPQNMLVIDTKKSPDFPLFGHIYASGTTILKGDSEGLDVTAAVASGPQSAFTYITTTTTAAASNQFIEFNDKTVKRRTDNSAVRDLEDEMNRHLKDQEEHIEPIDIRLNLVTEVNPNLTAKVIVDPIAGDNITAKGTGNIRTEFYNKGDVKMFGTYHIESGLYKFSLQEVIRKNFIIRKGSSITFNGDPMDAVLDIEAQHTVNSVSLADLIPMDSKLETQPHIKVDCIMKISGQIAHPDIAFSLELPNEREDVQTLVRNYISTEEQLNMQVLYLLGIGKFYTVDANKESSDMMSSVLSSTLSGQLNSILGQMISNNNWSFGTNVSTGSKGWTDVEVEGMLSGQLLNNRLLVNGHFGYRDNPYANSNFIGDFEAELLLNKSGNIRLKAYSRSNERYLFRTNMTTQGIGILFRKDFLSWREFLFWNNLKRNNERKRALKSKEKENKDIDKQK